MLGVYSVVNTARGLRRRRLQEISDRPRMPHSGCRWAEGEKVESELGAPFGLQLGAHTAPDCVSTLGYLDWPVSTFSRHAISDRAPACLIVGAGGAVKGEKVESERGAPFGL